MSRSEVEAAMCLGKEKHSRTEANKVVRSTTKIRLDAFKCEFCPAWHVGVRRSGSRK